MVTKELATKELIQGLGVADVVDAMMMTIQHRAHVIHLDSPDPRRVLFGPAVTIGWEGLNASTAYGTCV